MRSGVSGTRDVWENHGQFQDGEVGQTVVFFASCLVVEIIFEDADVGWIVSV